VLEEVRRQVGPDFIIGIRMTVDELIADGLDAKECLEIAVRLAKSGMVDVLNVWAGQARDWRSLSVVMANMAFPVAPFLHLASAVKAAVDIPIIHAQRISDVATAARAVGEGHVDLIGLTRPHMADPHIVRKLLEGRPDDIRQCVGANYCIDRIYSGGEALCIQNPATGREATMPHEIERSPGPARKVVVVGAGPAGAGGGAGLGAPRPQGGAVRGGAPHRRAGEHRRQGDLARSPQRHHPLARRPGA
jgi:NADH:flavin oxidoreductases, Old Yellow Enzyme family